MTEKWALYIRKSNEDHAGQDTLQTQRNLVIDYAVRHGYHFEPTDIYTEIISGTAQIKDRKELTRLLNRIDDYRGIIVRDITRLSRHPGTGITILELLRDKKKRLLYARENREANLSNSYTIGAELFGFLAGNFEADETRRRMTQGKHSASQNGAYIGSFPPYGYDKTDEQINNGRKIITVKTLKVNPEQAKIVNYIYTQRLNGRGFLTIAKDLQEMGVPSPRRTGWTDTTIRKILSNPIYTGVIEYGRTVVENNTTVDEEGNLHKGKIRAKRAKEQIIHTQGLHPAIISGEDFDRVQGMKKQRATAPTGKQINPFSGLLFCYKCGHALTRAQASGSRNPRYTHRTDGRPYDCIKPFSRSIKEADLLRGIIKVLEEDLQGITVEVQDDTKPNKETDQVRGILITELDQTRQELEEALSLLNELDGQRVQIIREGGTTSRVLQLRLNNIEKKINTLDQKEQDLQNKLNELVTETAKAEQKEEEVTLLTAGIETVTPYLTDGVLLQAHAREVNLFLKEFIRRIEVEFLPAGEYRLHITYKGSEDPDREDFYKNLRSRAQGKKDTGLQGY